MQNVRQIVQLLKSKCDVKYVCPVEIHLKNYRFIVLKDCGRSKSREIKKKFVKNEEQ